MLEKISIYKSLPIFQIMKVSKVKMCIHSTM